jgi:hypothetical protein
VEGGMKGWKETGGKEDGMKDRRIEDVRKDKWATK